MSRVSQHPGVSQIQRNQYWTKGIGNGTFLLKKKAGILRLNQNKCPAFFDWLGYAI